MAYGIILDPYSIETSSELISLAMVNFRSPGRLTELRRTGSRAASSSHVGVRILSR